MDANGTDDALRRALAALDDVRYVDLRVNNTNVEDALGIPGHSICALVLGRDYTEAEADLQAAWEKEVAKAIWINKAPGVGTYGSSSAIYIDDNLHENEIHFTIPSKEIVTVRITLTPTEGYDRDRIRAMIRGAIIDDINALGVGIDWGVTLAYRDIYNQFTDELIPFIVTGITGQRESDEEAQTVTVPCDYNKILYTDEEHIIIDDGMEG